MEYMKLILGILFLIAFSVILAGNSKRSGFLHGLFRIDTIIGIVAGLYLIVTATISLLP
jgi:hypothetical protein